MSILGVNSAWSGGYLYANKMQKSTANGTSFAEFVTKGIRRMMKGLF